MALLAFYKFSLAIVFPTNVDFIQDQVFFFKSTRDDFFLLYLVVSFQCNISYNDDFSHLFNESKLDPDAFVIVIQVQIHNS